MSVLNEVKRLVKSVIFSPIILFPLVRLFRISAITGQGSNLCLKSGFLPLVVNYHSPVPDIKDLGNAKYGIFAVN